MSNWFPGLRGSRYATKARVQEMLQVLAEAAIDSALADKADGTDLLTHVNDTGNPHTVTKTQVGLGSADDTADVDKPVSTAQQSALNLKADTTALTTHVNDTLNPHAVTAAQVGLGNADDTSDADKPISAATQNALDLKADDADLTTLSGRVTDAEADIAAGNTGAETLTAPGAVSVAVGMTLIEVASAAEAYTLADGAEGQSKTVVLSAVATGGTDTAVLTPATALGWSEATLDAVGQALTLAWTASGWAITGNNGVTIT